jgi:uncharacterized radical SAM superfamily Fe-S cluster-containing enzyme
VFCLNGQLLPITSFTDVEGLLEKIKEEVQSFNGSFLSKLKMKGMLLREVPEFICKSRSSHGLDLPGLLPRIFENGTRGPLTEFHNKTLFLGMMFFQDPYNMDTERLQRCGVHYALPDGMIVPFCSCNTFHRSRFSRAKK